MNGLLPEDRTERKGKMDYDEETFVGAGYVHYLGCGCGFAVVFTCQNSNCTTLICAVIIELYLKVVKNKKQTNWKLQRTKNIPYPLEE